METGDQMTERKLTSSKCKQNPVDSSGFNPLAGSVRRRMGVWRRLALSILIGGVLVSGLSGASGYASPHDETRFVAYLSTILEKGRSILTMEGLDRRERVEMLRDAASEYADVDNVKRIVLGPSFNALTPDQQDIYDTHFREYLFTTLSLRLIAFEDPVFKIQSIRAVGRHYIISSLATDLGRSVTIEWLMTNAGGTSPKVMDVIVAGASMLAAQRAEISQIHRTQGFDALIMALDQIAEQR